MTSNPTIIVVQHGADDPPGMLVDWLAERGHSWRLTDSEDRQLTACRAVVSLGSEHSAYETTGWPPRHIAALREAARADVPIFGICFGAQALTAALGGVVSRAPEPEIGWVEPQTTVPELSGRWLTWHSDRVQVPSGAQVLADSPRAVQAFTHGPHLGLQFHPEATPAIMREWIAGDPALAARHGGPDLDRSLEGAETSLRSRAYVLLDWWWDRISGGA